MLNSRRLDFLQRFTRNRKGTALVLFGLMAVPLVGFAGAAVDMARWSNAADVTKHAADSAVLAGVAALKQGKTPAEAKTVAEKYYADNISNRLSLAADNIEFSVNAEGTKVTANGEAAIETTLLKVIGVNSLPIAAHSGSSFSSAELIASSGGGNLEIAVMLDVTGSMCDDGVGPCTTSSKLSALKVAAKDLVDLVVWDDQSSNTSRVALVPFSTRVRVEQDGHGGAMMKKLTNLDATWTGWYQKCVSGSGGGGSENAGNWVCNNYQTSMAANWKVMPCVTDRFYNTGWLYDTTDDAPGAWHWMNAHDGGRMTSSWDSSDLDPWIEKGLTSSDPAKHWNFEPNGTCFDVANANEIMPLSSNKAALKARIDGLEAFGATAGALGTSFSWYMLSPKWKNVWPAASEPAPYSQLTETTSSGGHKLRKIAIMMSDGVYNTYRGWKEQDQTRVSGYATTMCTNMKAAGIEIFTVGFDLDSLSGTERTTAENTLKACGTDIEHFYDTLDISQLQQAFKEIAIKISADIALTE